MGTRWITLAAAGLFALPPALRAQPPAPAAPSGTAPPAPPAAGGPLKVKVCAVEPRKTTKVVYGSVCKQYCLPRCSLADLLRHCWGGRDGCGGCDCGPLRTRRVLVKKVVPGPDAKQCVIKEVEACVPCAAPPAPPAPRPPAAVPPPR